MACRHTFLWPVNYQPEICLLECSSGLLLLKPKPPPLFGLLTDPVFVFPEVMEPRCKLLYLWQQSLFLREEKKNINIFGKGKALPPTMHYCLPYTRPLSDLLITPTGFSIPFQMRLWCDASLFFHPHWQLLGRTNFNVTLIKKQMCSLSSFCMKEPIDLDTCGETHDTESNGATDLHHGTPPKTHWRSFPSKVCIHKLRF